MMKEDVLHGIALRPAAVEITTLRAVKNRWELRENRAVDRAEAVPVEPVEGEAAPPPELAGLSAAVRPLEGACAVGLPAEQMLLRVVELPTPDPDEIEGMIELQVDKFSPFPVEHLCISYEKLQGTEQSTRVLIAAVQRARIDDLEAAFAGTGAVLRRIDVDLLGWWRLLVDEAGAGAAEGLRAWLLMPEEGSMLVATHHGVPLLFRSIGAAGDMDRTGFVEAVVEEVNYTLTSLEAEWGVAEAPSLTVWHEGPPPRDLIEALTKQLGIPATAHALAELPPLSEGLARRASEETPGRADLAPPEWALARQNRRMRKNFFLATAALVAVWGVAVMIFMGLLAIRRGSLDKLRAEAQKLSAPAAEVEEIRDKVLFLERYKERSQSALEVLRMVTLALPDAVEINNFTYRKGANMVIRGEADRDGAIYTFYEALQQEPLLGKVTPGPISAGARGGRPNFSVTADLGEREP